MTWRGRVAVLWCSVAATVVLVMAMAAFDAPPAGDRVVAGPAIGAAGAQPTTTDGGSGDGSGGEVETEVAGKVVQRPAAKDVPSLGDLAEMPRTGTVALAQRLAIGLLLLGIGLLVLDHAVRDARNGR